MARPFKKITLPNGLRVLLVPQAGSLAASVVILVTAGSEYEKKPVNGISHFFHAMKWRILCYRIAFFRISVITPGLCDFLATGAPNPPISIGGASNISLLSRPPISSKIRA